MNVFLLIVFFISILLPWMRVFESGSHFVEGEILQVVPLPLLARMRMHSVFVAIPIIAGVTLAILNVLPWIWVVIPVVSAAVLVALPMRYTLTSNGISRTFGRFRRWTEFGRVNRAPGGARLLPVSGTRGMRIWLSDSRGDDEFLLAIRSLIRNAYKGTPGVVIFPQNTAASRIEGTDLSSTDHHIAAFTRD